MSPTPRDESPSNRLARKSKEAPFIPIGIAGLVGACAYGAYAYKNRGDMPTSVYLMHLRVRAQGMVVGAITFGVAYYMIRDLFGSKKN